MAGSQFYSDHAPVSQWRMLKLSEFVVEHAKAPGFVVEHAKATWFEIFRSPSFFLELLQT
jgi:hypothetical protein